jgi:hypothetical protein
MKEAFTLSLLEDAPMETTMVTINYTYGPFYRLTA